jgi:hypothetical protein
MQVKGVKILAVGLYQVESFSTPGKWYIVDRLERSCTCECFRRAGWCKHLKYVFEHELDLEWEEAIWKADREFKQWQRKQAPALAALKIMNMIGEV